MEESAREEKGFFSSLDLKLIAFLSMVIDHTAASLPFFAAPERTWLYTLMRGIGRLAFPLFAFLLAVGATRTRDMKKYLLRLGFFALLCEVPFDMMAFGTYWYPSHQNIFFTLFFALLAIDLYRKAQARWEGQLLQLLGPLAVIAAVAAGHFLRFDYGADGVILIFGLYMWRTDMKQVKMYPFYLMLLMGAIWWGDPLQLLALLAFFPMLYYNGKLGKKIPRYLFYWGYLIHVLILGLLRMAMQEPLLM